MDQFAYYTIRLRLPTPRGISQRVSGVVEDLASGQKQSFESGDELLRIVGIGGDATLSAPSPPPTPTG